MPKPLKQSATRESPALKSQPADDASLPEAVQRLTENPRVTVRRGGVPLRDGKCVVYWMQRAERGVDNAALDTAIHAGNALGLPVVALFSAIPNFPHANLRHYVFLQQGLRDTEEDLQARGVGFVVRRPPENSLEAFAAEVNAAMIVGDENPLREPERWRRVLASRLRMPYWTVDADVVVPSRLFTRGYYAVHHFRPHLHAELPAYLEEPEQPQPGTPWSPAKDLRSYPLQEDITSGWRHLDRSVPPTETLHGGTHTAARRLRFFIERQLANYPVTRRHPEEQGTSQLSPYLHFGHISVLRIALAAQAAADAGKVPAESCKAFLGELLAWRELCINFVRHTPNYDSFECAAPWAESTLKAHLRDRRDPLYTLEEMERGETYDDLWNAAQLQMVRYGWMHNIMRMYWAKKMLEWSPTPAKAFEWAVYLNDKYELDGRDPGGYVGIAWSIAGTFDRAWGERPIFGKIRYMSGASTGRKFNLAKYKALIAEPEAAKAQLYSETLE